MTLRLAGSYRGDPVALYAALRPAASAGYGGMVYDGAHWLLSLSPELFFSLNGDAAKVKPMKGTRPRGTDEGQDKALAQELAGSVKDKAENLMIVDLMRNDLSRVAEAGSVRVDAPFSVESYPTVHQMVSTVRARLQPGKGAADLIRAIFPCGSITGAPKIRAMELINEAERDARGPYCGAMGRIDANGDAARKGLRRGDIILSANYQAVTSVEELLAQVEAAHIRLVLARCDGRMAEAARRLGIGRSTLYRKLADLGIGDGAA